MKYNISTEWLEKNQDNAPRVDEFTPKWGIEDLEDDQDEENPARNLCMYYNTDYEWFDLNTNDGKTWFVPSIHEAGHSKEEIEWLHKVIQTCLKRYKIPHTIQPALKGD